MPANPASNHKPTCYSGRRTLKQTHHIRILPVSHGPQLLLTGGSLPGVTTSIAVLGPRHPLSRLGITKYSRWQAHHRPRGLTEDRRDLQPLPEHTVLLALPHGETSEPQIPDMLLLLLLSISRMRTVVIRSPTFTPTGSRPSCLLYVATCVAPVGWAGRIICRHRTFGEQLPTPS